MRQASARNPAAGGQYGRLASGARDDDDDLDENDDDDADEVQVCKRAMGAVGQSCALRL